MREFLLSDWKDLTATGIFLLLGIWKAVELLNMLTRKFE